MPGGAKSIEIRIDPFPRQSELAELWRLSWEVDGIADFRSVLTRSLTHVGAYSRNQLVGFTNMAWDGAAHAFLVDVCVHPDHRLCGIGRAMVECAVQTAKKRGAKLIHVDFEPHLKTFFLNCGFRSTDAGVLRVSD